MSRLYRLGRPLLFTMEPESAHHLSIMALKHGLVPRMDVPVDSRLRVSVAGISFPNPIGLAAGYDKNAEVVDAALGLGFGFVEAGTVTPRPQPGNDRPRCFRLPKAEAMINRFGFNNDGHADALERLQRRRRRAGIVGVNIGANKDADDRIQDYVDGVSLFESVADYLTVNISSPNTPGLRALQSGEDLHRLLEAVVAARDGFAAMAASAKKPLFVKVAPDLVPEQIAEIAEAALRHQIDGLIVSNTTLSRDGVAGLAHSEETGGLSGRPLLARSTWALAAFRKALGPEMPLIGVGGVHDTESALLKIAAGADLVQLYTAMVYAGPGLPTAILKGLRAYLDETGADSLASLRDARVEEIVAKGPPSD
ncbi:quinone-dependent dihydroorotate dehydrogenase [Consotaella salsifontis]|uniref:Dihydroorotate dehydrogenase (quinone) n=1 Tax=Consotaella salsifontis TaxID=1365950 RepID=A0A1T4MN91_9HYPH|nr:quinone-dependent dihydroorotate dehydrogenase [Consotaella salsifontis]SJZ68341.1 dihydroorotate oxidase A [Consotaella salsifontis]